MSIEAYARDIKLIGHSAYPDGEPRLLESVLIKVFINGLRDDTSRERVLFYKPKTLIDPAQYLWFSEAAVRVARGQSKVNASSVSPVNYSNQVRRNVYSNRGYRGNWISSKSRGRGHGPFRCYNCTWFGHIAKDCPTPALKDKQSETAQSSRKMSTANPMVKMVRLHKEAYAWMKELMRTTRSAVSRSQLKTAWLMGLMITLINS